MEDHGLVTTCKYNHIKYVIPNEINFAIEDLKFILLVMRYQENCSLGSILEKKK